MKKIEQRLDEELNRCSDDALKRRSTVSLKDGVKRIESEIDELDYKKRLIENELTYRKYPETRP